MNIYFEENGTRIRRLDGDCIVIEERLLDITEKQKKSGIKRWKNKGYFSTLKWAVRSFCDQYATSVPATSLKELTDALRDLEATVMDTCKGSIS